MASAAEILQFEHADLLISKQKLERNQTELCPRLDEKKVILIEKSQKNNIFWDFLMVYSTIYAIPNAKILGY